MLHYTIRRLLFIIPTLFVILTINFFVVQLAPGGPVEQFIATLEGGGDAFMERIGSSAGDFTQKESALDTSSYMGSRGLSEQTLKDINALYGFDKPLLTRYFEMLLSYIQFDFGTSLFKASSVLE